MSLLTGNLVSIILGACLWILAVSLEHGRNLPRHGVPHAALQALRASVAWIWSRRRLALPALAVPIPGFAVYASPVDAALFAVGAFMFCFSLAYTVEVEAMARDAVSTRPAGE